MTSKFAILLMIGLGTGTAFAQSATECTGDARNRERDLAVEGHRLSPAERQGAQQRLGAGQGLCFQDPGRGSADLEQLRRDMVQQAQRPPVPPPARPGDPGADRPY